MMDTLMGEQRGTAYSMNSNTASSPTDVDYESKILFEDKEILKTVAYQHSQKSLGSSVSVDSSNVLLDTSPGSLDPDRILKPPLMTLVPK
jgi:hypothetical protein